MALVGSLILAYAAYSYVDQRRTEAALEAQIPGQSDAVRPHNNPAMTNTPVMLMPALDNTIALAAATATATASATAVSPTPNGAQLSPSITPLPTHVAAVQPNATATANVTRTPTAIVLAFGTPVPTDASDVTNLLSRPTITPTPTQILAGVAVPTPQSGVPTLIAGGAHPDGVPRGSGSPATRLKIPRLNLDTGIKPAQYITYQFNGQAVGDWNVPFDAVGHLVTTAQPGENGNAVLSAHHNLTAPNTFGLGLFAGLWNLAQGDEIQITTAEGKTQIWRITQSFPIKEAGEPLAVRIQHAQEIMSDTPQPTLTLVTCWNGQEHPLGGNTYRWIVRAELVGIN